MLQNISKQNWRVNLGKKKQKHSLLSAQAMINGKSQFQLSRPSQCLRTFLTDHLLPFTNTHPLANQLPYCLSFPPCWFHPCYSLFLQHCLLCCHGCCGFTLLCVHLTNPVSSLPTGLSQSFPKRNVLFPSCETIFPDRYLRQGLRHRETRKGVKLLE